MGMLYAAATFLAVTSATVVTGLNSLGSFEAGEEERGRVLGALRSWGQLGRAMGPVVFCSLFWWAGREVAYNVGGCCMVGVCVVGFWDVEAGGYEGEEERWEGCGEWNGEREEDVRQSRSLEW